MKRRGKWCSQKDLNLQPQRLGNACANPLHLESIRKWRARRDSNPHFHFQLCASCLEGKANTSPYCNYKYRRKRKKGKPLLKVQTIPTKLMPFRRLFWSEHILLIFLLGKGLQRPKSAGTDVFKLFITNEERSLKRWKHFL